MPASIPGHMPLRRGAGRLCQGLSHPVGRLVSTPPGELQGSWDAKPGLGGGPSFCPFEWARTTLPPCQRHAGPAPCFLPSCCLVWTGLGRGHQGDRTWWCQCFRLSVRVATGRASWGERAGSRLMAEGPREVLFLGHLSQTRRVGNGNVATTPGGLVPQEQPSGPEWTSPGREAGGPHPAQPQAPLCESGASPALPGTTQA